MPIPKDIKAIILTPAIISTVAVLIAMIFPIINRSRPQYKVTHEMSALIVAIDSYRGKFEKLPEKDSILRRLCGDNAEQIKFLEWPTESIGSHGQPIDQWGTDYQITLSTNRITIISAGKNKRFGDKDDITKSKYSEK